MNKVATIRKLNETELELEIAGTGASWHQKYLQCHAIYVGGLPDTFTEENLLAILEQYGTILHVNLIRDSNTNASRGFAFAKYADPRSCILAIDNLNGFELNGRTLRLDHADDYRNDDGAGIDSTPPGFREHVENVSGRAEKPGDTQVTTEELQAEKRRENAVLNRLEELRKRRRMNSTDSPELDETKGPSSSEPIESLSEKKESEEYHHLDKAARKQKRIERERRRREKERRKEERARIRKERAERRAARQNAP